MGNDPAVVVVDDHTLVAAALAIALRGRGIPARAVLPTEFVDRVDESAPAGGIVVLDLGLGSGRAGVDLIPRLRRAGWRVLLLTASLDRTRIAVAVAAGAVGWIAKSAPFDELVAAAVRVAAGQELLTPGERARMVSLARTAGADARRERARWERLTPRERQVVTRIAAGRRPAAIAGEFVVSVATVRTQIRSILTKLEVGSQLEVAALAQRRPSP